MIQAPPCDGRQRLIDARDERALRACIGVRIHPPTHLAPCARPRGDGANESSGIGEYAAGAMPLAQDPPDGRVAATRTRAGLAALIPSRRED